MPKRISETMFQASCNHETMAATVHLQNSWFVRKTHHYLNYSKSRHFFGTQKIVTIKIGYKMPFKRKKICDGIYTQPAEKERMMI